MWRKYLQPISGGEMSDKKELCVICAWRENCQKKFSMKAGQRCPDFSRDFAIKDVNSEDVDKGPEKEKK